MKILVISNSPFQHSGYGKLASNVIYRLFKKTNHTYKFYAMSGLESNRPLPYIDFKNGKVEPKLNVLSRTFMSGDYGIDDLKQLQKNFDLFLFMMDAWVYADKIEDLKIPYICYAPIDAEPLSHAWESIAENALKMIPYTKFGKKLLEDAEFKNVTDYIYHGVDTDVYKPGKKLDSIPGKDKFMVMINKRNVGERIMLDKQLQGVKIFLDNNPDARDNFMLYLHMLTQDKSSINATRRIKFWGLNDVTKLAHPQSIAFSLVDENKMAQLYNTIDVLLNCTGGEGFGFPIIEAFACGKPVIGLNYSSMPELIGEKEQRGWLADFENTKTTLAKETQRAIPKPESIAEKLGEAYNNKKLRKEKGEKARKWIQKYNWNRVVEDGWVPLINGIEEKENKTKGDGPISAIKREKNIDKVEWNVLMKHIENVIGHSGDILEIGSGTGSFAKELQEKGYNVKATDISHYCVQKCKERGLLAYKSKASEVSLLFKDEQFDAIVGQHILEHTEDDIKTLKECLKVLKKGGLIALIVPGKQHLKVRKKPDPEHRRYYDVDEIKRIEKEMDKLGHITNWHIEGELDYYIGVKK